MTPALLDDLVRAAASEVRGPGPLPDPRVGPAAHAEYTTTLALRSGVPPQALAAALAARPEVATAVVAGPGFVNLDLTPAGRAAVVADALADVPDGPAAAGTALPHVRYAHARCVALIRNAADLGVAGPDPGVLDRPEEIELVRCLVAAAEPRVRALEALADAVLALQPTVLPRGDEEVTDRHRARLAAVVAARAVLARGLARLGLDAPERL